MTAPRIEEAFHRIGEMKLAERRLRALEKAMQLGLLDYNAVIGAIYVGGNPFYSFSECADRLIESGEVA